MERSPEVYHVLEALDNIGCDVYVDVHGDEEIPANFFASTAGIPGWTPRLEELFKSFRQIMHDVSRDFQQEKGYGDDEPGKANLAICGDQVAQRFNCLAVTLEQPFKDAEFNAPAPAQGWSPQRAKTLGASMVTALLKIACHDKLPKNSKV